MHPGYRLKTKQIKIDRDNSHITTKAQVIDIIEKYHNAAINQEFYEIEPAEVIKVWMDETEEGFPTKEIKDKNGDVKMVPDYSALGACIVSLRKSLDADDSMPTLVYPISPHIVQYPLKGEVVNVAAYEGKLFYSNPLNLLGNVNTNRLSGRLGEGKILLSRTKYNRKVYPDQGDLIIQGRFGQAIRMGSDAGASYTKPNLKISVGQGYNTELLVDKNSDDSYPHIEDINNDEASIWLTTNEHIPLQMKSGISGDKTKSAQGSEDQLNLNSLITLNADGIIFNSKRSKIHMFSDTKVNISAVDEINLETAAGKITLLDPNSKNPLVMGKQLQTYLDQLVSAVYDHQQSLLNMLRPLFQGTQAQIDAFNALENKFQKTLGGVSDLVATDVEGNIAPFLSNRAFIGVNDGNGLDLDQMWEDTDWSEWEPKDVTDDGYEVEKITATAGVRG